MVLGVSAHGLGTVEVASGVGLLDLRTVLLFAGGASVAWTEAVET